MTYYEIAYLLGKTYSEIMSLSYEELAGWIEYFTRRPHEWRADNRAYIIATAMSGSKLKPEELFDSLRAIKDETTDKKTVGEKFIERFGLGLWYDENNSKS